MSDRYRGRHRGRHARPAEGPLTQALGMVRRPAVTAGMALALVGTGAVGVSANDAVADAEPFTLSASALLQAASSAEESASDSNRISGERTAANTQRAALTAQAQAAEKAKADAAAKVRAANAAKVVAARKAAAAKVARDKQRTSAIANAQNDPRSAARALMPEFGFTSDAQWNCLNLLWEGESSWNYKAENSSSGAYGLPQSLPASKMATVGADYRTNPITQIKWGLGYIKQSYGTPCGAWEFWNNRYPHWY